MLLQFKITFAILINVLPVMATLIFSIITPVFGGTILQKSFYYTDLLLKKLHEESYLFSVTTRGCHKPSHRHRGSPLFAGRGRIRVSFETFKQCLSFGLCIGICSRELWRIKDPGDLKEHNFNIILKSKSHV